MKREARRSIISGGLALLSAASLGCSAPVLRPAEVGATLAKLESVAVYVDRGMREAARPKPLRAARLLFPYIPGDLYGAPGPTVMFSATTDLELRFKLDLTPHRAAIDRASTVVKSPEMKVEPKETRFGRVGTFPHAVDGNRSLGGGAFYDPATRSNVLLVYVDRPCTMGGSVRRYGMVLEVDLKFAEAGFHWVRLAQVSSPNHHFAQNMPASSEVNFAIVE
jgi:hypothetical protein